MSALDFVIVTWIGPMRMEYIPTYGVHQVRRGLCFRPCWRATWAGCQRPVRAWTYNGACRKAHRRLTR